MNNPDRSTRPVDPRLLRYAKTARGYLMAAVVLGAAGTGMMIAQAELVARLLAGAGRGTGPAVWSAALIALLVAVATRGLDGLDPYFARYLPQLMLVGLVARGSAGDGGAATD